MVRTGMVVLVAMVLAAAGCTSYYIVKDPSTGKSYYTTDLKEMKGGSVKLKDEKTGAVVTIQNSEIREVDSGEYKATMNAPPPAPAPANPPPPAPASTETTPAPAPAPAEPAK